MRYIWILGVWSCMDLCAENPSSGDQEIPVDSSLVDTGSGTTHVIPDVKPEHVVIIVMDGARIEETFGTDQLTESDAYETPVPVSTLFTNFKDKVLPQGTLVRPGYNTGITITGPGHCSLLTGIRQNYGQFSTPGEAGWYRPQLPTIYEAIRKVMPDAVLKVGGNTEHVKALDHSIYPGVTDADGAVYDFIADENDAGKPNGADESILTWMEEQLGGDAPPTLMLGNMHSMDRAGHYNSSEWAYGEKVAEMDDPLVNFWSWVQSDASGVKDKTLMIVVADHGRHRWGDEEVARLNDDPKYVEDFQTHGDQCRGCREVPMFLVGPGIKAGQTLDLPYTLEDVARTAAYSLGVDFPTADGLVMKEAYTTTPDDSVDRSGSVSPAVAGSSTAAQVYTSDPWLRSEVTLDGTVYSSGNLAEEPKLVSNAAGTFACWRELTLDVSGTEIDWPWAPRCFEKNGTTWEDIGFPVEQVWPLWTASMQADGSDLLVSFADNSNATTYSDTRGGVRMARWDGTSWTVASGFTGVLYPGNPALVMHDGKSYVAYAASDVTDLGGGSTSTDGGRYTRHIEVQAVDWSSDEPTFTELWRTYTDGCPAEAKCPAFDPTVDAEGFTYERMEQPTLADVSDGMGVAFVAYSEEVGNTILVSQSNSDGSSWDVPWRIDTSGRVLGHIDPVWVGSKLVFARLSTSDTVEICRSVSLGTPDCIDTDSPRIAGLAYDGTTAQVSVDVGTAQWEIENLEW